MRNTITKISAAISAAVLLALPTIGSMNANAAANANARYTFREVYYAEQSAGINKIGIKFACKKTGVSSPSVNALLNNPGFSGVFMQSVLYYTCEGNCKRNSSISGPALSISLYGNTPTSLTGVYSYVNGFSGETYVEGAVKKFDAFLVGDFNGDKKIDRTDLSIITSGLNNYNLANADFKLQKTINGTPYDVYKFDIDDNGVVNSADKTMLSNYISGKLQRFAK